MAQEIERKFLVTGDGWRSQLIRSEHYRQAYLASNEHCSVRVRTCGDHAWLNIKSATPGVSRQEFEYSIPATDGEQILRTLCTGAGIDKMRHFVRYGDHLWEIDEFRGENAPLIVAEIELGEIGESFDRPDWLGREVTDDPRYYNASLSAYPYSQWCK